MSAPITWQNIQGANLAAAAVPLAYAGQTFDKAFDRLGGALTGYEQGQQKDLEFARLQQKNAFLNVLAQAKSPEELAALEQSGALQAAQAGMDPMALASVRGAAESRNAALMGLVKESNSFDDALQSRQLKQLGDQHKLLIQNSDIAGAEAFVQANANVPGFVNVITESEKFGRQRDIDLFTDSQRPKLQKIAAEENSFNEANLPAKQSAIIDAQNTARRNNEDAESLRGARNSAERSRLALEEQNRIEAATKFVEKQDDTAITNKLFQARDKHLADIEKANVFSKVYAKQRGYAMKDGEIEYSKLTPEQIKEMDNAAVRKGFMAVGSGDTDAYKKWKKELVKSGQFTQAAIDRNDENIRKAFDSKIGNALVGNDASNKANKEAKADVELDKVLNTTWGAPGTPTIKDKYNSLAEDLVANPAKYLDMQSGLGVEKDISAAQGMIYKLALEGIEVEPGKFATPPMNVVLNAMRTASGHWINDSKRSRNMLEIIKSDMKKSQVLKDLAISEQAQAAYDRRLFQQKLKGDTGVAVPKSK